MADADELSDEILEFRPVEGAFQPRRTVVPSGALDRMDDSELVSAFRRSRPIGGDYFGRPGKRMADG